MSGTANNSPEWFPHTKGSSLMETKCAQSSWEHFCFLCQEHCLVSRQNLHWPQSFQVIPRSQWHSCFSRSRICLRRLKEKHLVTSQTAQAHNKGRSYITLKIRTQTFFEPKVSFTIARGKSRYEVLRGCLVRTFWNLAGIFSAFYIRYIGPLEIIFYHFFFWVKI